jgi:hypothetical protein
MAGYPFITFAGLLPVSGPPNQALTWSGPITFSPNIDSSIIDPISIDPNIAGLRWCRSHIVWRSRYHPDIDLSIKPGQKPEKREKKYN